MLPQAAAARRAGWSSTPFPACAPRRRPRTAIRAHRVVLARHFGLLTVTTRGANGQAKHALPLFIALAGRGDRICVEARVVGKADVVVGVGKLALARTVRLEDAYALVRVVAEPEEALVLAQPAHAEHVARDAPPLERWDCEHPLELELGPLEAQRQRDSMQELAGVK
eukprot:scaffold310035_cov27-Tisochrysis_lutea.AAC.2